MTNQEIEQFLERQYTFKKPQIAKFPDEVKQYIFDYAEKHNWEGLLTLQYIFKNMKLGYTDLPNCEYDGCNNKKKITDKGELSIGCCKEHSKRVSCLKKYGVEQTWQSDEVKFKIEKTTLERFGTKHNSQSNNIKEKKKKSYIVKYGVEHPMQTDEVKTTLKNSIKSKYGVDHQMMLEETKNKIKETCLKNYGVENPSQSETIKEKKRLTTLKNFGVEYPFQSEELREKSKQTWLNNYGVHNPILNPEIFEKAQNTTYKKKDYAWKSGDVSNVQGYENIVLNELENSGYSFEDIKTHQKDIPTIWYFFNGKKKRYYPDIFIPSENLIIEVKSTYTYEVDLEKNLAKEQAVLKAGFNFRFEIR